MKQEYDFDKNFKTYQKNYEKHYINPGRCYELCKKWVEWVESIPRSGEKKLREFTSQLSDYEKDGFLKLVKNPLNPLSPINCDLDIIFDSADDINVTKLMEQPEYLKEVNRQPFYKNV